MKVKLLRRCMLLTLQDYRYEGPFNDENQRHGHGRAWFVNGDEYEGDYDNGRRQGNGVYR